MTKIDFYANAYLNKYNYVNFNTIFMEQRRKDQLLKKVDDAYKRWCKKLDPKSNEDNVEEVIQKISDDLAFGTIIVAGRYNPSSYIGTYTQCKKLKNSFDGQIGVVSHVWYWTGYANSDTISKIVANKKKNLVISVPLEDLEDAILNFCEVASLNIRYEGTKNGRVSYIGGYKECILLRKAYKGKIGKINNHWHWFGYADFYDVEVVYRNYQRKNRRYKRKKIVLTV